MFSALSKAASKVTLERHLRSITHSEFVDVSDAVLAAVVADARDTEMRSRILRHVASCLAPNAPWRRLHGALVVVLALLAELPVSDVLNELNVEFSGLRHGDVREHLQALRHYECTTDPRVSPLVREQAQFVCKKAGLSLAPPPAASTPAEERAEQAQKPAAEKHQSPQKKRALNFELPKGALDDLRYLSGNPQDGPDQPEPTVIGATDTSAELQGERRTPEVSSSRWSCIRRWVCCARVGWSRLPEVSEDDPV
mmetsp:Transcript_69783/g.160394  ORF Transcript_69783/g.160394 Transcript_69783/m.160394 type:complete len:254 (-) Transcript_69783:121-882(-)